MTQRRNGKIIIQPYERTRIQAIFWNIIQAESIRDLFDSSFKDIKKTKFFWGFFLIFRGHTFEIFFFEIYILLATRL